MGSVKQQPENPGQRLAHERFMAAIDAAIEHDIQLYPERATFVGADMPGVEKALLRAARERRPIVLVFPDGEERVIDYPDIAELRRSGSARSPRSTRLR